MNPNKLNKVPPTPKPMFHNWKDEDIIKFHENILKNLPNVDGKDEIEKSLKNTIQEIKDKNKT
jgi:hypothetical protein